jgi:hypothetical protein
LSEYGVDVLFDPTADRLSELRRLNHATLAEFISLVNDMCGVTPSLVPTQIALPSIAFATWTYHLSIGGSLLRV